MWGKSFAAIIGGCFLSVSIMLNLNQILPVEIGIRLLVGLLISFPIWVAVMVWCYASESTKQAWLRCLGLLAVSGSINAVFMVI
ncbi:MAG: hypothetical protein QF552_00160 [Litorilituus sp.]|jgi:hypothetical protein|nr:hypothetical protein [Litorilituus sp.]